MEKVLRVATFANFNFTDKEFEQLDDISEDRPEYRTFVNTNSYPKLRGKYPAIVTINPALKFVPPKGDTDIIKAVRVKYIADARPEVEQEFNKSVNWAYKKDIPILVTYMRFKKLSTLKKYTRTYGKQNSHYKWEGSYYRQVVKKTWELDLFNYCDLKDKGCPSCGNCAKLPFGIPKAKFYSINLSSSGKCPYNCPDCFAKYLQNWGGLCYDRIIQNSKQEGHDPFHKDFAQIHSLEDFLSLKNNEASIDNSQQKLTIRWGKTN
jgi:hypothetical protein